MIEAYGEQLSEAYLARCQKRLRSWGAPLQDWYCVRMYDVMAETDTAAFAECDLCDCPNVRYVHVMRHDKYFEDIEVGCICAGIMEGDILAAREREKHLKNRAKRRRNFISKPWVKISDGCWEKKYRGQTLRMLTTASGSLIVSNGADVINTHNGKRIADACSAAYAAFDMADQPKEACRHA